MLFNTLDFAIFLPVVFLLYWFVTQRNLKVQNIFLLIASYVFYGWWDVRFLGLIILSSLIDYVIGYQLGVTSKISRRKTLLAVSLIVNLGVLGFFKYCNFFIDNFTQAFQFFGHELEASRLDIILSVGISFYTFQTLSYTIDIYRGKLEPAKNIVSFFTFVSFFPQLVAGPIERATHLLPQFYKRRFFHYSIAVDGCKQILWGLVKKVVIADQCARYADEIFNNHQDYSGSTLVMGALFFTFQIYGDFSGYSDIAIGTAKLFGFDLKKNFATPYFPRDIAEFWRRWHISLSTWFRDYVYIPLGGSKGGKWNQIRNVFIIFLVSGFWHGANWTFILWGFVNALFFIPLLLRSRNRNHLDVVAMNSILPSFKELMQMLSTFILTVIAWVFFRADSLTHALDYLKVIFSKSLWSIPTVRPTGLIVLLMVFIVFEWISRRKDHVLQIELMRKNKILSYSLIFIFMAMVLVYSNEEPKEFIYFQF